MNKRFKELMIESMIETGRLQDGVQASYQRFGEKVVRECMNICKKHPSRDLENLWTADAVAPDLVRQFEEHFGVEE